MHCFEANIHDLEVSHTYWHSPPHLTMCLAMSCPSGLTAHCMQNYHLFKKSFS